MTRARFLLTIGKIQSMAGSQDTSPYRLNSPPPSERELVEGPTIRERIKDKIDHPSFRVLSILMVLAVLFGLGRIALAFVPMNCAGHKCPTTLEYGMSVLIGLLILATPFGAGLFCYATCSTTSRATRSRRSSASCDVDLCSRVGQVWVCDDSVELIVSGRFLGERLNETRWRTVILWSRGGTTFDEIGEYALARAEKRDLSYSGWARIL